MSDYINFGADARKAATQNLREYLKLKDGESIRGYFPTRDYVYVLEHGDFDKKINSHLCKDPRHKKDCLSCQHGVKLSKTFIVPFYDVDKQQVLLWKTSAPLDKKNKHLDALEKFFRDYEEDATKTPVTLSRSGEKAQTSYSIMPISAKTVEKNKDLFVLPDDLKFDREFYSFLQPPSEEYHRKLLKLDEPTEDIQPIDPPADNNGAKFF